MRIASGILVIAASAVCGAVQADLYQPEQVYFIKDPKTSECGVRADYRTAGSTLRVEVLMKRDPNGLSLAARAYRPNETLELRDIWLRTANFFTLERFHSARENSNGIMELRGDLDAREGSLFLADFEKGDLEVSVIFDGPGARLPIGFPTPLPNEIVAQIDKCLSEK